DADLHFVYKVNNENVRRFSFLLIPLCSVLNSRTYEDLERLARAGGRILFIHTLPRFSSEQAKSPEMHDRVQGWVDTLPNVSLETEEWFQSLQNRLQPQVAALDSHEYSINVCQRRDESGTLTLIENFTQEKTSVSLSPNASLYELRLDNK